MFHQPNIRKAILRLKRGSSPRFDGINADLVLLLADDKDFLARLQELFNEWQATGHMGYASRTAIMSTLYKDKGDRSDWSKYRPVSVTTILYRIYGGCLEQGLSVAVKHLPVLQREEETVGLGEVSRVHVRSPLVRFKRIVSSHASGAGVVPSLAE